MGKMRRKGEQRQNLCVYCGKAGLITDDHVFPKAIFRQLDNEMITVPACFLCNQTKSLDDCDLRNYIVMDLGGSHSGKDDERKQCPPQGVAGEADS